MNDLVVYGISLALVGAMVVAIIRYYAPTLDEKYIKLISAFWAVGSYLLVTNLELLEGLVPSLPTWLPQALTVVLIFGAALGLAPGESAKRVWFFVRRK